MKKKYMTSVLAASVAAAVSLSAHAEGYSVVDMGALPDAYSTTSHHFNDIGEAVVINSELWNQNIRFDLLNEDDFEEVDLANPSDNDYRRVRNFLNNQLGAGENPRFQKLGQRISHLYDGNVTELTGFDSTYDDTGEATDSVNVIANDINAQRMIVGQATKPYSYRASTDQRGEEAMYFIRDSFPQGFVTQNDNITYVQGAPDMYLGGTASILKINDSNQAVGYASVAHSVGLEQRIEDCQAEPENGEEVTASNEELVVCVWRFWHGREVRSVAQQDPRNPIFVEQAYMWEFDESGGLVNAMPLGSLEEVPEDGKPTFRSTAFDVNAAGIAVGRSLVTIELSDGRTQNANTAVAYRDGEVIDLLDNYFSGSNTARAINDNNIIVGTSLQRKGLYRRERMFVYDLNDENAEAVYPTGFFSSSSWTPRAINNNGVVVGRGEASTEQQQVRPTVGFAYDIGSDEIKNLNEYLACDSDYRIVDAFDINDAGEILALATVTVSIDIDGEPREQQALRAVRLQPGAEACNGGEQEISNERQGAAVHPVTAGLMALLALFITRRRALKAK
ncbi:DUF3466 family protein [Aliidiomarina sp. Khilg15.8]